MTHDVTAAKKTNRSPSLGGFDASAAHAEPEAKGQPEGRPRPKETSYRFAEAGRLAPMLLFGLLPFAVLLFITENNGGNYVSPNVVSLSVACWMIGAVWVTLEKGRVEDISSKAWLLLGLFNLMAALGTLLLVELHLA